MARQRVPRKTLPTTTKRAQKGSKKPADSTKKVQKKTPKVKEDPLQVALAHCRAMIPYNKEKKLGQKALYYLSQRYKLLTQVKCPTDTLLDGEYAVNQILCDKFLGDSPLSRHYLVCWEGHMICLTGSTKISSQLPFAMSTKLMVVSPSTPTINCRNTLNLLV